MSAHAHSGGANTLVGQAVERAEDIRFLRGEGSFAADYEPAGDLHAAILRSSVAHGRIRSVGAAQALPGVHAVITADDIGRSIPTIPLRLAPLPGLERYLQPVIATEKVRYVGEPVAVVLAEAARSRGRARADRARHRAAARRCRREGVGAATTSAVRAERDQYRRALHGGLGDADAAFAGADYVRRESFRAHRHTARRWRHAG